MDDTRKQSDNAEREEVRVKPRECGEENQTAESVKTPAKDTGLGSKWRVSGNPLGSDYTFDQGIDETPDSSDSVQHLASGDSVRHYGTRTLGSASSQDSVVYCGTVRPPALVKLQSAGVVLPEVKEKPAVETKTSVAEEAGIKAIKAKEDPAKKGRESKFFASGAPAFKHTGVKRGIDSVKEAAAQSNNKVAGAKFKAAAKQGNNKLQRANTFPSTDYQKLSDRFSTDPQVSRNTAERKRRYELEWEKRRAALHAHHFAKTGSGAVSNFFRLPK